MASRQTAQVVAIFTLACFAVVAWLAPTSRAQLPDKTVTPNAADTGLNKSFTQQAGVGRGDVMTSDPGGSCNAATAMCSAADPDEHGMT